MIPAWSDARKMVRRASKLTDDGEESDRSEQSSPHQSGGSASYAGQRRTKSASSLSSASSPILSKPISEGTVYGSTAQQPLPESELKQSQADRADSFPPPPPPPHANHHHHHHHHDHHSVRIHPTSSTDSLKVDSSAPAPELSLSSDLWTFYAQLRSSPFLSSLLIFCPLGLLSSALSMPDIVQFLTNFLSIIPLAWLLGMVTEEIALRTSETMGALLNATFGNAVELIVSLVALQKGLIRLVQTSLLGSVLSNLLLVLGTSFLLGGLRYEQQVYNRKGAQIFASMLLLACLALAVPSAYVNAFDAEVNIADILDISRITAAIIFAVYLGYLYFQLITHTAMFEESPRALPTSHSHTAPFPSTVDEDGEDEEDEESEEAEEPLISLTSALLLLLVITLLISFCSDNLLDSIAPVTRAWSINESFIGIILLPIVGNAAEHATAVTCALKNKLDLSIGVAVGSSTQIALMVIPFVTLVGWVIGQPMTLNFSEFEMIVLVMAVLIVNFLIRGRNTRHSPEATTAALRTPDCPDLN